MEFPVNLLRTPLLATLTAILFFVSPSPAQSNPPASAEPTKAPAAEVTERWYIMEMMGGRVGHMHSVQTTKDGSITSDSTVQMSLKRGEISIDITMETQFVETTDGKPISMRSNQKLGRQEVVQEFTWKGDKLVITSKQSGQVTTKEEPAPSGEWLTPAAAERLSKAKFDAGEKTFTITMIDPSSGVSPIKATRTVGDKVKLKINDTQVDAITTTVETDKMPGVKSTEYLDSEGELLKTSTQIGGLEVLMVKSTKAEAVASTGGEVPEIMLKTFITPNKPVKDARHTIKGVYVLKVPEGELPAIPSTGSQTIVTIKPNQARLTIDRNANHEADAADAKDPRFLASTALANTADERIKSLAERATRNAGKSPNERAEAMRAFVNRYIRNKTLGVGFATATEVARSREGDCTEHGVLLAAMLRADGIPSRVATGLLYADQFAGGVDIFGYHMWTQALLDVKKPDGTTVKSWVDLDGVLPRGLPFDATHICLGTSDLADGDPSTGMVSIASMMGRLQIDVESVEHATKPENEKTEDEEPAAKP